MHILSGVVAMNEEKVAGKGEDAALCIAGEKAAVIASMDGCGGSGAKRYPAAAGWTGAKIASSVCGNAIADWFETGGRPANGSGGMQAEALAAEMKTAIKKAISTIYERLGGAGPTIKGSMVSPLPTTMSAVLIEQGDSGKVRCTYFWAGDSRGYLLTTRGLREMTKDDVQTESDEEDFQADGLLTNVISARGDFNINVRETYVEAPVLVLTATDGCYAYYKTPMEFEGALLRTLMEASGLSDWEERLKTEIGRIASDDYTMQIAIIGFQTFQDLQNAYRLRAEEYRLRFGAPAEQMLLQDDREGLMRLWREYKKFYR